MTCAVGYSRVELEGRGWGVAVAVVVEEIARKDCGGNGGVLPGVHALFKPLVELVMA